MQTTESKTIEIMLGPGDKADLMIRFSSIGGGPPEQIEVWTRNDSPIGGWKRLYIVDPGLVRRTLAAVDRYYAIDDCTCPDHGDYSASLLECPACASKGRNRKEGI